MDITNMGAAEVTRKAVLTGAGVGVAAVALAACSGGSSSESGASSSASSASDAPSGSAGSAEALAKTADVPVGSGVIVGKTVVTQPNAGDFKAFSAVCTHSGCLVNKIADGTIDCPCHGSKFSLDGAVVNGPAKKPLEPITVRVQGDSIVQG